MHKILIDWRTVKREITIDFDIDTKITYENFCNNPIFDTIKKIADDILNNDAYALFCLRFIILSWHVDKNIVAKAQTLLLYDVFEEYTITSYNMEDYILKPFKEMPKWWFSHKTIDTLCLNEDIDLLKSYFTNNYMLSEDLWKQAWIHFENPILRMNYDAFEKMMYETSWKSKDEKDIDATYNQTLSSNYRFAYTLLMSLLLEEPLYLITDDRLFDFTIVSQNNIWKHLITNWLIWNLKQLLWVRYNDFITDIDEKLSNIRKEYMKNDSEWWLKKVIDDITKLVSKVWTTEINIQFQNHNPMHMTWKFKTNNMKKYEELKEYTSDYGHVTHQNHGWKKSTIIWEKQFKYKPNKDWKGKGNL